LKPASSRTSASVIRTRMRGARQAPSLVRPLKEDQWSWFLRQRFQAMTNK
jgi:hypothetical protein